VPQGGSVWVFEFKRDPQPAWPRPASTRRGLTIEFSGLTIVDVPRALILDSLLLPKLPARERPKPDRAPAAIKSALLSGRYEEARSAFRAGIDKATRL